MNVRSNVQGPNAAGEASRLAAIARMAEHSHGDPVRGGGGGSARWVFWGFALIAAFFLITEHRAHVYEYLPLLLLLACPLMHLFHGHGGHGSHGRAGSNEKSVEEKGGREKHAGGCH
jgi:hypothetical protein